LLQRFGSTRTQTHPKRCCRKEIQTPSIPFSHAAPRFGRSYDRMEMLLPQIVGLHVGTGCSRRGGLNAK
jgi:hypothetical protein